MERKVPAIKCKHGTFCDYKKGGICKFYHPEEENEDED